MFIRTIAVVAASIAALLIGLPAVAQDKPRDKIKVVATFSILGDLVKNVGGDRLDVTALVGPNGDAHVYAPSPADVRKFGEAKIVVMNGLGFEGWINRLVKSTGGKAATIVATKDIKPLKMEDDHHPGRMISDPHAWQSVANTKLYIATIRDGLIVADPAGKAAYDANAQAYLQQLDALEKEVRTAIDNIPAERRRVITSHDAFGYFSAAYGLEFISPEGVSRDSEATARDVAKIIRQIRKQSIPAVFLENVSNPRLMQQIAKETGARIGGALYSDALSEPNGPAGSYIGLMRHNIRALSLALTS